ncbi:hypothetical protein [Marinagarivorans cellulosilyticus]|uniref:Uncharacterized protein n=1 Tax=Marinagarivorans cellulosilyticus TaxID=2721545 RepID=A0AAN1WH67_9GAMM|nr:hypothetical protein [Marinagarivorans cellulosilyticus]BCD97475.1 hypothetical protein MARGE09_P1676 [Marinagarivorans cellulosilyticus]
MKVSDEDTTMSAMQSAYQAGIVARASRRLIECHNLESFLCCAHKTLQDLGCSGFAQFQFNEESRHIKFGDTVRLHQRAALHGAEAYVDGRDDSQFTYHGEQILLIIDIEFCNPRDSDILKDNVAIFADSMSSWLDHHSKLHRERVTSAAEKLSVVNNLNNFTRCLYRINDHLLETQRHVREDLLSQLITAFPVMGLDADQENTILDIVNAAIERENQLLGSQIKQNIELRSLMESAVEALTPAEKRYYATPLLDDDIILFN